MKLTKTSRKSEYMVFDSGIFRGYLYREYVKSTGAWAAKYVGHTPGCYEWVWDVENSPQVRWGCYRFESFKDAKNQTARLLSEGDNLL